MDENNSYFAPVKTKQASKRQDEKWDEAVTFFNNKQYDLILPTLLEYVGIDPQSKKADTASYVMAHGSVVLTIEQTDTELKIRCPFLDMTDAKKIPLMRRLAEMRMYPLNLTNIILEKNLIYFSFSFPIHFFEP